MSRAKMWFGTEDYAGWISCPLQGASVGPESWGASGVLLNGGGYSAQAAGSHRVYQFEWRQSSSREAAQLMQDYRDGVHGGGLIYFHDPLTFDTNVFPKQWAFPGLAAGAVGNPFSWRKSHAGEPLAGVDTPLNIVGLPATGVEFTLIPDEGGVLPRARDRVFIPRPAGYGISITAWYTVPELEESELVGVYGAVLRSDGTVQDGARIPESSLTGTPLQTKHETGRGVYVWVGHQGTLGGSIALYGLRAVLYPLSKPIPLIDGWFGGQGHSGVRFEGSPTYVENTGVNGGQISYAASFREIGDWR